MTVTINSPSAGARLSATATVTATFSGTGFDIATCTLNGQQLASDSAQPISMQIDTTRVPDGPYTMTVAVRHQQGSKKRWQKATQQVTVSNSVASEWTKVADEGGNFSLAEAAEVRYGAGGQYAYRILAAGTHACTNAAFGGDPAFGQTKSCEKRPTAEQPPPDPEPSPGGTLLDSISDFTGPSLHPEQISEISTPHGPGFRFNHSHTGGAGNGVQLQDWNHFVKRDGSYLGTTNEFSGRIMFPSAGNPQGFADFWDFNVLWEYGPGLTSNNQFGINGVLNKIYVRSYKAGASGNRQKAEQSGTVLYDYWYRWVWRVKWSEGSDGAVFFKLDDEVIANWTGPTQPPGNIPPWIQWGYYTDLSVGNISGNIIEYADIRVQ